MTGAETSGDRIRRRVLAGLGLIVLEGGRGESRAEAGDAPATAEAATPATAPASAPAFGPSFEHAAFELVRFWFDVVWAPGLRYMDGFKGDRRPALEAAFRETFSDEEYLWLERFNRFLELRVDRLSDEERREERFPAGDTWRAIVRDARNLLELLDPSGQERLPESKLLDMIGRDRT